MDDSEIPLSKPHVHSPLISPKHIRLLHLLPASQPNHPLECRFTQDSLLTCTASYDAVSYTWGEPDFCCKIYCLDDNADLNITPNADILLRRFRDRYHVKVLWVDALCINQQDEQEKSTQVPLMHQIYRTASKVLAWLGQGGAAEEVIPCIQTISRGELDSHVVLAPLSEVSSQNSELQFQELVASSHFQYIIRTFLSLPWFYRRWIIQEVVLNTEVYLHYGQHQISWFRFMTVLERISANSQSSTFSDMITPAKTLFGLWKLWSFASQPSTDPDVLSHHDLSKQNDVLNRAMAVRSALEGGHLVHLLVAFDDHLCSDPRDKIYALGALAGIPLIAHPTHLGPVSNRADEHFAYDQHPLKIDIPFVVNYNHDVTQCYTSFAASAISRGHVLWVLAQACERNYLNDLPNLPSWAPNWQIPSRDLSNLSHQCNVKPIEIRDGTLTIELFGRTLNWASGDHFVTIADGVVYPRGPLTRSGASSLDALLRRVLGSDPDPEFLKDIAEAISRLPPKDDLRSWPGPSHHFQNDLSRVRYPRSPDEDKLDIYTVLDIQAGRSVFLTVPFTYSVRGSSDFLCCYFGLSACATEPGDKLVSASKYYLGFVLRPADGGCDELPRYRLVGTASFVPLFLSASHNQWRVGLGFRYFDPLLYLAVRVANWGDIKLRLV